MQSVGSYGQCGTGVLRVALCGVVAPASWAEYAILPQSRTPDIVSILSFTHTLVHAHLSQMSCLWVRSQRILSEKQFWHVLERSWAEAAPLADGLMLGGARDMAGGGSPAYSGRRDHGETASREGTRGGLGSAGVAERRAAKVVTNMYDWADVCDCGGSYPLRRVICWVRCVYIEHASRRGAHSLSVDPCIRGPQSITPAVYLLAARHGSLRNLR